MVSLGAVCELEDPFAPPRVPILDGRDDVILSAEVEGDATKSNSIPRRGRRRGFVGRIAPSKMRVSSFEKSSEIELSSFYAVEFADLSDGRRVVLRDDRGWFSWPVNSPNSEFRRACGRELTKYAILCLDPDDNEEWAKWIVNRLHSLGIEIDPTTVHSAPFVIEFGPLAQRELRERSSGD